MYSHQYANDLKNSLGVSVRQPLVSLPELFLGKKEKLVVPQLYKYSNELALDFYAANTKTPSPWVLIVHGGGWNGGDKTEFSDFHSYLANQGTAVVAVSYRLAPQYKWPAQRDDVLAAVSFIKAKYKDLNVDPERWAIMGRSAGGQIAEAVAYQIPDASLKGVIAFYAPSDLEFAYRNTTDNDIINSRTLLVQLLGGDPAQASKIYADASPLNFVTRQSPPTLLLHGRPDPLTWFRHSRRLLDKIHHVGAQGAYLELPWATHAFDYNLNGPGGQIAKNSVDGFLTAIFNNPQNEKRSLL
jgi:acetyl esterase/lipase